MPLAMVAEGFGTFLLVMFIFALTEGCNSGTAERYDGSGVYRAVGLFHHLLDRSIDTGGAESCPRLWSSFGLLAGGLGVRWLSRMLVAEVSSLSIFWPLSWEGR